MYSTCTILRVLPLVASTLCWAGACAAASSPTLVIAHANVIDVATGRIDRDRSVVIRDGRILEIRRSPGRPAPEAIFLDATGKYLIPGLWDMHYHFNHSDPTPRELDLLVANGVLGIRDMGDQPNKIFPARSATASGELLGPQIVACGPIVDGPEPTNPSISVSVHDAEDARAMAHTIKDMGADCIKVHDGVPLEAYLAIADEARKIDLPLVGHVPVRVRVRQATDAGQRGIEHQIGLRGASTVEAQVMESEKTNDVFAEAMRTKNFALIPESIAQRGDDILDHFDPKLAEELYRAFVRNGTYIDPTLVTERALTFVDDLARQPDPRFRFIPSEQRQWWNPERGMLTRYRTPAYIAFRKREFQLTMQQIPVAARLGVRFLAGTDNTLPFVYPGFSVHEELALFVRAGLTSLQALQTATLNPARFLHHEDSEGTVQAGRRADLVLLDGNPLDNIDNTQKIRAVVLQGRLLTRGDLDELLQAAEKAAGLP